MVTQAFWHSIAAKIGCTAETQRRWVRQAERDQVVRAGSTSDERERIKALERAVCDLRQANAILRKASASFAMPGGWPNEASRGEKSVGRLLRRLGFSLQAHARRARAPATPTANAQFEHINAEVKPLPDAGEPAISVNTKKKELIGEFKHAGRELRPKGQPEPVRAHDFAVPDLEKAVPSGICGIPDNTGWVNLGISHDTAAFVVESIRRWWHALGTAPYPTATRLLINADCRGSTGSRVHGPRKLDSSLREGLPWERPVGRRLASH